LSDEETTSVENEAVAGAAEAEQVQEKQESEAQKRKRNEAEHNWAEANRLIKEQKRELRELKDQLQAPKVAPPEEDELSKLAHDDILTVAQAKKLVLREAEKIAENAIRKREAATVDERLATKFTDFSEVVSKENIELLKTQEPELALGLWRLQDDPYAQGIAAYKLMKKLGISKGEEDVAEKKKAVENSKKPVSVNAVTKSSAIGNAHLFENGLTPELKAALRKEMDEARKRA
jgi:hypothetical protein